MLLLPELKLYQATGLFMLVHAPPPVKIGPSGIPVLHPVIQTASAELGISIGIADAQSPLVSHGGEPSTSVTQRP